jgi:hypothetical protein
MNCRALLLSSFLIAFATVSSAHEPKGHIDLDVVSKTHLFQRSSLCAFRAEAVKHRGFPGGNLTLIRSSQRTVKPNRPRWASAGMIGALRFRRNTFRADV